MATHIICCKPMASNSDPQPNLKRRTIISAVLLAVYLALAGWLYYVQTTSWPHEGSWVFLGHVFLCPGILFQSFSLAYTWRTGRLLARRVLTRVFTIPLGLLLAGQLAESASTLAMSGFEQAYAPFVSRIGANLPDPCAAAEKYFAIPAVAAYNARIYSRPRAQLNYDSKRFVVSFLIGSLDIDGGKIYFDSGARNWRKFHNNIQTESQTFKKLTEGLATCELNSEPAPKR